MTRRRAKPIWLNELPIRATKAQDMPGERVDALLDLSDSDPVMHSALTRIACDYLDGRRMQSQRAARPDCRRTLEALGEMAGQVRDLVDSLPLTARRVLGRVAREALSSEGPTVLPESVGSILEGLTEIDMLGPGSGYDQNERVTLHQFTSVGLGFAKMCRSLPMEAEWLLILAQEQDPLITPALPDDRLLQDFCDALRRHAFCTADIMKSQRGPKSDMVRLRAVAALKREFEMIDEKATHNPKDTAGYSGIGSSPFDLFVDRFFRVVEPGDTQRRGLNDALLFVCRRMTDPRRPSDRERDPE